MLVTMKKREHTSKYAIYDYFGEDNKDYHGVVKLNFVDSSYEWLKHDCSYGIDDSYYYHKAIFGLKKMIKSGELRDTYMVANG